MSRVTSKDGTSIAFTREGAGPAVILVDAACGFRGFGPMGPLATLLASQFTVITYDRRGRGESTDTLPYTADREVEDLEALIDAAGGSASLHGFSSGAVLALRAAARGLPIGRLVLLEPPLRPDDAPATGSDLGAEITQLVAAGRRGDAVELFQRSIGVPAELTTGMRQAPFWPVLESIAHTLAYDTALAASLPLSQCASIRTPTLVLASEASDERLRSWARALGETLPDARHRTLPGDWHGIPAETLAPVLAGFFAGSEPR